MDGQLDQLQSSNTIITLLTADDRSGTKIGRVKSFYEPVSGLITSYHCLEAHIEHKVGAPGVKDMIPQNLDVPV